MRGRKESARSVCLVIKAKREEVAKCIRTPLDVQPSVFLSSFLFSASVRRGFALRPRLPSWLFPPRLRAGPSFCLSASSRSITHSVLLVSN